MIRLTALALFVGLSLLAVATLGEEDNAQAGALPSNIPGDSDCSGQVNIVDAYYDLMYYAERLQSGLSCQTNGNVICGGNIDLADIFATLQYSAGASVNPPQPANCPAIGVDAVHSTVDKGDDTIHGTYNFNFDDGTEVPTGDIWWSIEENSPLDASIVPRSGVSIAILETFMPFSDISYAQVVGAEWTTEPLHSSVLQYAQALAIKTDAGNYTKVKITALEYDMQVQWVTYSPLPAP